MANKKRSRHTPDLTTLQQQPDDDHRNRLVLAWLEDDRHRELLFNCINANGGALDVYSRAAAPAACHSGYAHPRPPPDIGHTTVKLITNRKEINAALNDGGVSYSSRVYAELGGGNFVLALDPMGAGQVAHARELTALSKSFRCTGDLKKIAHRGCESAAILSLGTNDFDLAAFAEQAALRFCMILFGYAEQDFPLLERALRAGYLALVYQVLGRHFTTEPGLIPAAQALSGALLARTAAVIDAYATDDEDGLSGIRPSRGIDGLKPVLKSLSEQSCGLNGEQSALIAVGAAAGTVGNVQAAVCIVVKALFADKDLYKRARTLALQEPHSLPSGKHLEWDQLIGPALSANPPIPFLPRVKISQSNTGGTVYEEVLLALGAATVVTPNAVEDALVWGHGPHACFGKFLARPLIIEIVRHVMALPNLAEGLDPLDASIIGLKKRWGFLCESYPFTYRRDQRAKQFFLNVAMRVKSPIEQNAMRLREVIRSGAPRIQELLNESRHVHFAWFEFIESDTVLVLHTVYDGDFAAYIDHFAEQAGDLFDRLFESIEDAPPKPVAKHPNEFVALIQRYNRAPALGYFYSAYPRTEAATVTRQERAGGGHATQ